MKLDWKLTGPGLLLIGALLPATAMAHGPTRQKITLSTEVPASPDEVWSVIGDFQDMTWHPAIAVTEGEGGNEIDATRVLYVGAADGPTIDEVLYKYDADRMTYSYRITEVDVEVLPVTNYSSHLTVTPIEGGSEIEWRGAFYRGDPNGQPPEHLNDEAAISAVTGVYDAGLQALAERFAQ